jgi:hypothetical protein
MNQEDIIIELEKRYNNILLRVEEKPFYIGIAQYIKYILQTSGLSSIVTDLQKSYEEQLDNILKTNYVPSDIKQLEKLPQTEKETIEYAKTLSEELKKLINNTKTHDRFSVRNEASADYAWVKLLMLSTLIFNRESLLKHDEYVKDTNSMLEEKELDSILLTKEQKYGIRPDLIKVDEKTGEILENKERGYFIREDYVTYLSLLHDHLIIQLRKEYKDRVIVFPPGHAVMYQNGVLFFKLGDGTPTTIDFNSAHQERSFFEAFWNLRLRKPGEIEFTPEEVVSTYIELHRRNPDVPISRAASAIRKRRNDKPALTERLQIDCDRTKNKWIFNVK